MKGPGDSFSSSEDLTSKWSAIPKRKKKEDDREVEVKKNPIYGGTPVTEEKTKTVVNPIFGKASLSSSSSPIAITKNSPGGVRKVKNPLFGAKSKASSSSLPLFKAGSGTFRLPAKPGKLSAKQEEIHRQKTAAKEKAVADFKLVLQAKIHQPGHTGTSPKDSPKLGRHLKNVEKGVSAKFPKELRRKLDKIDAEYAAKEGHLNQAEKTYNKMVENFDLTEHGTLATQVEDKGELKQWDTGIDPDQLFEMVYTAVKTNETAIPFNFPSASPKPSPQQFYSFKEGKNVSIVHKGEFIAKGGGGTVSKALDIGTKNLGALKEPLGIGEGEQEASKEEAVPATQMLMEAKNLQKANPKGKTKGLQPPPHLVFKFKSGGTETETGVFFTKLYEGDLTALFSEEPRPIAQVSNHEKAKAIGNFFQAVVTLDKQGVGHLDIKPANVFCMKGEFDIADFDQLILFDELPARAAAASKQLDEEGLDDFQIADIQKLRTECSMDSCSTSDEKILEQLDKDLIKLENTRETLRAEGKLTEEMEEQIDSLIEQTVEKYREVVQNIHASAAAALALQMITNHTFTEGVIGTLDKPDWDAVHDKIEEQDISPKEKEILHRMVEEAIKPMLSSPYRGLNALQAKDPQPLTVQAEVVTDRPSAKDCMKKIKGFERELKKASKEAEKEAGKEEIQP